MLFIYTFPLVTLKLISFTGGQWRDLHASYKTYLSGLASGGFERDDVGVAGTADPEGLEW